MPKPTPTPPTSEKMTPAEVRADILAEANELRAAGNYERSLELCYEVIRMGSDPDTNPDEARWDRHRVGHARAHLQIGLLFEEFGRTSDIPVASIATKSALDSLDKAAELAGKIIEGQREMYDSSFRGENRYRPTDLPTISGASRVLARSVVARDAVAKSVYPRRSLSEIPRNEAMCALERCTVAASVAQADHELFGITPAIAESWQAVSEVAARYNPAESAEDLLVNTPTYQYSSGEHQTALREGLIRT